MSLKRAVKCLIFLGLLTSPINGSVEYLYTLGIDLYPALGGNIFWVEKGVKDGLLLLILGLTLVALANKARIRFNALFFALLSVILLSFALTLIQSPLYALIGARTLLPVLLILTGSLFLQEEDLDVFARILTVLVIILVPLALVQFVFGSTIYGLAFGKYAARIIATFCMPGSFGIFLVVFIMFAFLHLKTSSYILIPAAAGLIVLTGSGMSLVALCLFGAIVALRKVKNPYARMLLIVAIPAALPLVSLLAYHLIPIITGRENIWQSLAIRLELMTNFFRDSGIVNLTKGRGLGYCTNTAFNLLSDSALVAPASIPDSLYLSLFSQIGVIGGLLFIAMNIKIYNGSSCRYKIMIPVLMFTGLTMNLLELFPVNWIYMLLLGVCSQTTAARAPAEERTVANA